MASVAGIGLFSVMGPVQFAGMQSALKSRPGVDGYDVQWIGVRGEPYVLTVKHDFVSAGSMKAGKVTLFGLMGTLVDVADDFGNVANGHLVQKVQIKREGIVAKAVGGFNSASGETRYWMEAELTLCAV